MGLDLDVPDHTRLSAPRADMAIAPSLSYGTKDAPLKPETTHLEADFAQ